MQSPDRCVPKDVQKRHCRHFQGCSFAGLQGLPAMRCHQRLEKQTGLMDGQALQWHCDFLICA